MKCQINEMKNSKLEHSKENGFKTPEGYFDTIEDAVFSKLSSEKFPDKDGFVNPDNYLDTVEDSVLKKMDQNNHLEEKKQTGFTMPEAYLNTFDDKVLKAIKNENHKVIDFKTIFLKRIIPFAIAASFLLFIFIKYNSASSTTNLDQLATTEIEQWIENDLITFDTYEITEVYSDVDFENQLIFEDDEVIDYLNGTDIESLILEN